MRLALYQPDIPQNTGAILRLAACMGIAVDIIEPCGFLLDDRRLQRVGMDYLDHVAVTRHSSWDRFAIERTAHHGRLLLLTTKGTTPYVDYAFDPNDILMVGRESAGVPEEIHKAADARLLIPMAEGVRSLNVALAAAMVLGEALRQTGFPMTGTTSEAERLP
ncbi:MAG: tRNA (cytidine(34)-2'-O)-methyltransferase [Rhodospirillaceae bacterium]|nr:tRNA (cytidine(34)-2'-O)-methyltransferase [Rhodospirillaceae bacterium]MBT5457023.1 tRNA (cytidine(34)-2'-O)-methyltransferase [Rhodospirillaceae bacterium]